MNAGISNRRKQRKQSFRLRSLRSLLFRITPVIYKTLHWLNLSLSDSVRMRRWDPQSKLTSGLIEVNSVVYAEPNKSVKDPPTMPVYIVKPFLIFRATDANSVTA
jgi:hypothetical protein